MVLKYYLYLVIIYMRVGVYIYIYIFLYLSVFVFYLVLACWWQVAILFLVAAAIFGATIVLTISKGNY